MNAQELIEAVEECKKTNWRNSDLYRPSEILLEAVSYPSPEGEGSHCPAARRWKDYNEKIAERQQKFSMLSNEEKARAFSLASRKKRSRIVSIEEMLKALEESR